MSKKLIVKDDTTLVRDSYSKAILNTDTKALQENRRKRAIAREIHKSKDEVVGLKEQVATLQEELATMKEMLQQLLSKKK